MKRIYYHLSDHTLKQLYVATKRAKEELISKAPIMGAYNWYMEHVFGKAQMDVDSGVWAEMYERGLLNDDNDVVS